VAGWIRFAQPFPPYNPIPLNRLTEPTLQRLRRKKDLRSFPLINGFKVFVVPFSPSVQSKATL